VLGAKKGKLGAKKVVVADADLDFEAAERKAKEEAERIAKLGYNPDDEAEAAAASKNVASVVNEPGKIASPTPVSPGRATASAAKGMERSSAEMERLGMGMGRLGFGQTASKKPAAPKVGFGQMSRAVASQEGGFYLMHFFALYTVALS
jgi:ADP-ribosylation factor GTPase-activating protein 2/3